MYIFGKRSIERLAGVEPRLVKVAEKALTLAYLGGKSDFGISEGLRMLSRQKELVASGKSKTLNSKHLPQKDGLSHAIDIHAYVDGKVTWDSPYYVELADAFKEAAKLANVRVRWGGAWHKCLNDIGTDCSTALDDYVKLRKSQGLKPFLDLVHYQIHVD